jgi:hypothetical protein
MNLVALLIAPVVVEHAQDTGLRIAIGLIAAAVLAGSIYISKSRKSELDLAAADAAATTAS